MKIPAFIIGIVGYALLIIGLGFYYATLMVSVFILLEFIYNKY